MGNSRYFLQKAEKHGARKEAVVAYFGLYAPSCREDPFSEIGFRKKL